MLLKIATQYLNYHFGCKTSVLNYITKALANELRSIDQANSDNLRFKDVENFKEKYLTQIEIDPSKIA
ncbi:hypothetical protein [Candidatus Orientia mediorientalis]|uniref:hypothetical protein n=1 Tax=Candidatus Orientia mediorientalis TaxID=911112 RepID=UPI001E589B9C|nr:hypothetical protein [Candidatus Orientia mediorientalis]